MYLAVDDRKSANPYVGHVMSLEWDLYFYEKESFSYLQPKKRTWKRFEQLLKRVHQSSPLWEKTPKSKAATDKN